ncbi:MAG: hypothetical protein ACTSR8_22470 [Promethearchaeota archaeon]
MIFKTFRITGNIREPLLFVEEIFIFFCIEMAIIFFYKFFETRKIHKSYQDLSYGIFLLAFGAHWICFLIGNFYIDISSRYAYLNTAYFILTAGAFFFIYFSEKEFVLFRKYLFSSIFFISTIILVIVFLVNINYTQITTMLLFFEFIIFFILYLSKIITRFKANNKPFPSILGFIAAFLFISVGYAFTSDLAVNLFGFQMKLVGDVLQLIGTIILSIFAISIPPLTEINWRDKVNSVFLMLKTGPCLFNRVFFESDDPLDKNIITGFISSVNIMLEKLTKTKGTSIFKKSEEIAIVYPSNYIIGVSFCKEDLMSLRRILQRFVIKTEKIFGNLLLKPLLIDQISDYIEEICNEFF